MSASKSKLILIDGHALVHRAFHAIRTPMTIKDGTPANALFGFISMFLRLYQEQKPTYLIACFDPRGKTFRHKQFSEYKATRVKTDPTLHEQIPLVMQFLESWCVPIFVQEGWEADDLLGTLSKQAEQQEIKTIIFTSDRDLTQLISEKISVYTPMRRGMIKKWGKSEVQEHFGVAPDQVVDFKAIAGDSSDNIPGVAGIGLKGAAELLTRFGNLENIYGHLDDIKEGIRKKLSESKKKSFLSRDLATIRLDAPIELKIDDSHSSCDFDQVDQFFEMIGFKTLRQRFAEIMGREDSLALAKPRKLKRGQAVEEQLSLF